MDLRMNNEFFYAVPFTLDPWPSLGNFGHNHNQYVSNLRIINLVIFDLLRSIHYTILSPSDDNDTSVSSCVAFDYACNQSYMIDQ